VYYEALGESKNNNDLPKNKEQANVVMYNSYNNLSSDESYCPEAEGIPKTSVTSKVWISVNIIN